MIVRLREVLATEKTATGAESRGMGGVQHEMFILIDALSFLLCVVSPEEENEVLAFAIEGRYNSVCQLPPAQLLVRNYMCVLSVSPLSSMAVDELRYVSSGFSVAQT